MSGPNNAFRPVNSPPRIAPIVTQTIVTGGRLGPIEVVLEDNESPGSDLTLTVESDNDDILPVRRIELSGVGYQRTLTGDAKANATGIVTLTLTVRDPQGAEATTSFLVEVGEQADVAKGIDTASEVVFTGDLPWRRLAGDSMPFPPIYGNDMARSGAITHNQVSSFELEAPEDSRWVSFWWRVSSEPGDDVLRFLVDGNEDRRISGEQGWRRVQRQLAGGETLAISYEKDSNTSIGADAGYVDYMVFSDGPRITVDSALGTAIPDVIFNPNGATPAERATVTVPYSVHGSLLSSSMTLIWGNSSDDLVAQSSSPLSFGDGTYQASFMPTSPGTYYFRARARLQPSGDVVESPVYSVLITTGGLGGIVGPNTAPTISSVDRQIIAMRQSLGDPGLDVAFIIGDNESLPSELSLSVTTPSPTLVPDGSWSITAGAAGERTLRIIPPLFATGSTVVTLTVTDPGGLSATTQFTFDVYENADLAKALDIDHDTAFVFSTGGAAPWYRQTETTYHLGDALVSGDIIHNEESWFETTVPEDGWISYYWKSDTEDMQDILHVTVDGIEVRRLSGNLDWRRETFQVSNGAVVRWTYRKDATVNAGQDRVWVDKMVFVTEPEVRIERTIDGILAPEFTFNPAGIPDPVRDNPDNDPDWEPDWSSATVVVFEYTIYGGELPQGNSVLWGELESDLQVTRTINGLVVPVLGTTQIDTGVFRTGFIPIRAGRWYFQARGVPVAGEPQVNSGTYQVEVRSP